MDGHISHYQWALEDAEKDLRQALDGCIRAMCDPAPPVVIRSCMREADEALRKMELAGARLDAAKAVAGGSS